MLKKEELERREGEGSIFNEEKTFQVEICFIKTKKKKKTSMGINLKYSRLKSQDTFGSGINHHAKY